MQSEMAVPTWLVRSSTSEGLWSWESCSDVVAACPGALGTLALTRPELAFSKEASWPLKPAACSENWLFRRDWVIQTSPREGTLGPHSLTKGVRSPVLRAQEERGHHRNWDREGGDGDTKLWSGE